MSDSVIKDGTGNGYRLKVSSENRLMANTIVQTGLSHHTEAHGRSFAWSCSYNYDAGDTIILVKSTDPDLELWVEDIHVASDTATEFVVHCPPCETPTGTAVTGVNLDRASAVAAKATAICDETTNTQSNVVFRGITPANHTIIVPFTGSLALANQGCIAVDFVTAGTLGCVTIHGWYHKRH